MHSYYYAPFPRFERFGNDKTYANMKTQTMDNNKIRKTVALSNIYIYRHHAQCLVKLKMNKLCSCLLYHSDNEIITSNRFFSFLLVIRHSQFAVAWLSLWTITMNLHASFFGQNIFVFYNWIELRYLPIMRDNDN